MKKAVLFLSLVCFISAQTVMASDEISGFLINDGHNFEQSETQTLINTENMKNKENVDTAKRKIFNRKKFYINEKEFVEQKALDYVNQQNNTFIPAF